MGLAQAWLRSCYASIPSNRSLGVHSHCLCVRRCYRRWEIPAQEARDDDFKWLLVHSGKAALVYSLVTCYLAAVLSFLRSRTALWIIRFVIYDWHSCEKPNQGSSGTPRTWTQPLQLPVPYQSASSTSQHQSQQYEYSKRETALLSTSRSFFLRRQLLNVKELAWVSLVLSALLVLLSVKPACWVLDIVCLSSHPTVQHLWAFSSHMSRIQLQKLLVTLSNHLKTLTKH